MNWLKNQKIATKLGIAFAVACFSLLVVIVVAVGNLGSLNSEIDNMAHDKFVKTVLANNMIGAVNTAAKATKNILMADESAVVAREKDRLNAAADIVNENFNKLKESITSEEGKRLLGKIDDIRKDSYYPKREEVFRIRENGQRVEAEHVAINQLSPIEKEYVDAINDLIALQTKLVEESADNAAVQVSNTTTIIYIIGIVSVLLVVYLSFMTVKGILVPVNMVKERMSQLDNVCLTNLGNGLAAMSHGDLTAKVEKATKHLNLDIKDEVGQMANVFDSMLTKAQAGIDAYEEVRDKIRELNEEIAKLIDDSKDGLLDNRGNVAKFEGAYRKLIQGTNEMLDAVILPVQDGAQALEQMSTGDLTVRVTADYKGQHRKIKDSINNLGDSLEKVVKDVAEAVAATASASTQISSSSEEMAAGAQEQSAQATEVAGAVEQMASTIIQTTKNASTAADSAKNAGKIAQEGGSVVYQTVEGMNRIAEVVSKAAVTVQELGKSSDQIGEIVQVIDDIADQTNLLALNAAIEAARAGEQGRGFAVVADEVRKLAERTTKATKEIAAMIKAIQKDTGDAVNSMEEGTEEVEKGKDLANKAGESLKGIISASDDVLDVISQVATASEEQSAAAEQISKNIESISSVTHESAAGVQQIARASEDLNQLTENLQRLISQFKISDGNSYTVADNGRLIGNMN